jgi:hypothetical protein
MTRQTDASTTTLPNRPQESCSQQFLHSSTRLERHDKQAHQPPRSPLDLKKVAVNNFFTLRHNSSNMTHDDDIHQTPHACTRLCLPRGPRHRRDINHHAPPTLPLDKAPTTTLPRCGAPNTRLLVRSNRIRHMEHIPRRSAASAK